MSKPHGKAVDTFCWFARPECSWGKTNKNAGEDSKQGIGDNDCEGTFAHNLKLLGGKYSQVLYHNGGFGAAERDIIR